MIPQVALSSLVGVWRRRRIAWPGGREDRSTEVYWLQAGSHYADLRIPAERPSFEGVRSLDDCTPDQLRWLARQQGFAGTLNETANGWHWIREIDYQPPTGKRDIGRLRYTDAGASWMIEEGVEEPYVEDWERIDAGGIVPLVLKLEPQRDSRGYLVAVGGHFLLAVDHRPPLPAGSSFEELSAMPSDPQPASLLSLVGADGGLPLQMGEGDPQLFLNMELSLGFRHGAPAEWRVTRSTFPWREGRHVFEDHAPYVDPTSRTLITRNGQWRLLEPAQNITAPPLGLMHWPVK